MYIDWDTMSEMVLNKKEEELNEWAIGEFKRKLANNNQKIATKPAQFIVETISQCTPQVHRELGRVCPSGPMVPSVLITLRQDIAKVLFGFITSLQSHKVAGNEFTGSHIARLLESKLATREQIHDVVAIASAFSMFNRYVCALGLNAPKMAKEEYRAVGLMLAERGYIMPTQKPVETKEEATDEEIISDIRGEGFKRNFLRRIGENFHYCGFPISDLRKQNASSSVYDVIGLNNTGVGTIALNEAEANKIKESLTQKTAV